jgi:hypothetical protein
MLKENKLFIIEISIALHKSFHFVQFPSRFSAHFTIRSCEAKSREFIASKWLFLPVDIVLLPRNKRLINDSDKGKICRGGFFMLGVSESELR